MFTCIRNFAVVNFVSVQFGQQISFHYHQKRKKAAATSSGEESEFIHFLRAVIICTPTKRSTEFWYFFSHAKNHVSV